MNQPHPPYLGAAYYPEDWPLEQIDEDIALMKAAGLNAMRVGEFAWSRMEPQEGRYDFAWLHLVVDKLHAAGLGVILCTPTATPPVWLSEKHPDILYQLEGGRRRQHGARAHFCPNSPVYREHCARIVTRLAEEFGRHPAVIGWQIDNEVSPVGIGARSCQCPACMAKFRQAMERRYGTIDALNAAWGTDLWSQTYQSFAQLPTPDTSAWHHPSLLAAWTEFASDSYCDYVGRQADILHRFTSAPVGTDMMPYDAVDYGPMHRALDIVQFNHYNSAENLWQAAFWFDFIRPQKPRPFWNTETQTCWNGSVTANGYREPGFCRVNSWLPIALGGEANLYWLWRQHWSGQELMHGAVVASTGRPLHIFAEVQEIAAGFRAAAEFLNATRPASTPLALTYSQLAARIFWHQSVVKDFHYPSAVIQRVYHPLIQAQLRPDVAHPMADLAKYRMIVSPFLVTLDEENLRARLQQWVEAGGTWVVGPMADIRNEHAVKYTHAPYGNLEDWAGVYCKYEIPGDPRDFALRWNDGREAEGSIWYDGLELRGAEALATYTEGPLAGLAAVARKAMGKGQVILLGTLPRPRELQALVLSIGKEVGIAPVATASENVLVVPREGDAGRGWAVLELENRPGRLTLPRRMRDLLTGTEHEGEMDVPPYTVMVLEEE